MPDHTVRHSFFAVCYASRAFACRRRKQYRFPGGVAAVDIAVDEIRVARVLEVVVGVLDLLPGLRDLRGEIEVLPVKGEPPVDIFLRCSSPLEQSHGRHLRWLFLFISSIAGKWEYHTRRSQYICKKRRRLRCDRGTGMFPYAEDGS